MSYDSKFTEAFATIENKNHRLLNLFEQYLLEEQLTMATIKQHQYNIFGFVLYRRIGVTRIDELRTVAELSIEDITNYLGGDILKHEFCDFSRESIEINIVSFEKFIKFLLSKNLIYPTKGADILETIRDKKEEWIKACDFEGSNSY
ncbi:hypothetical protein L3V83_13510 [Thiotrichales bacterium 19X7-9]|nr:hypothetical protein [Thiotrichales bacterium 19X7-9]